MIYHLAVAADYRRQGLGTLMMKEVESRLKAKGCRKAYLLVRNENGEVKDFYQNQGWSDMSTNVTLMGKEL